MKAAKNSIQARLDSRVATSVSADSIPDLTSPSASYLPGTAVPTFSNPSPPNNTRKEDLTTDELRSRGRFKDYSEQQLTNLLHTLKSFTQIVYSIWAKTKSSIPRLHAASSRTASPDSKKLVLEPTSKRNAA